MSGTALADIAPRVAGSASQFRKQLDDFGTTDFGASNTTMKYSAADAAKLMAEFDVELEKAVSRDPTVRGDISKAVAPQIQTMLQAAALGGGQYGDTISQVVQALRAISPDVMKDITITSPLSSGFVPYDLQAPSKKVFPALTPLRNRIPRTQGQGTAARFKRVDGISGSGTAGLADQRPFISEFSTTSTWGSSTLVRPPKIAYSATDQTFNYRFQGLSDSVTFGAEWAGRGFESMRALSSFSLLKSMMLNEEKGIIGGRINALAAPAGTPTGTPRAAQTGETAITGATTNVFVKVTALAQFGESAGSTASAAIAVTNGTSVVDVQVATDSAQALAYKLYVSTGVSDPGDASRFFAVQFGSNFVTLQGALPTTNAIPTVDSGTNSANDYDGLFAQIDNNGGIARRLNAAPSATMFDSDLASVWDKYKADPDEVLINGTDRLNFSNAVIPLGSQNLAYRIMLDPSAQDSVVAGAMVSAYQNKVTGKALKLTVHPWFKQGSALIASWALPFPWSEVPNTVEVRNVQDYLQIDWPVIQMSYDLSILLFGALVVYAPIYFLSYHGIAQTYGAAAGSVKYS